MFNSAERKHFYMVRCVGGTVLYEYGKSYKGIKQFVETNYSGMRMVAVNRIS